ncbi:MAG: DUF853 family protein [Clostridia bacterium]|nr:DUF853 family protein [Clostridia bacterium]
MLLNESIWLGTSNEGAVSMLPSMANRHGLIAGATGTGKTVTLQVMAEGFSQLGVPVFMADIKGDLSGLCKPGEMNSKIEERMAVCGLSAFSPRTCPVTFWDVYGEKGHPVRTTVSEMGPLLFSRLLQLNDTQSGVIHLLFRIADDEGFLLIDLKDVKAMLVYVGENASRYTLNYGNISKASIGAIQRAIAILEDQGGDAFFGEPALSIADWLCLDENGKGMVNILAADKLFSKPAMYSTFMLWMLSELYELLPEQGDSEKPRMVFFFDEAHLLFDDCPKMLLERVEQTVRLIRSKGVGVYFVTQSPTDIPSSVLSQLSNKVQHALRAFTPQEQRIVKTVAQTFRTNPLFDTEEALTQLATGEALLSFLQEDGTPSVTQKAIILPPQSSIGMIAPELRSTFIETGMFAGKYEQSVDRESAYELLSVRFANAGAQQTQVVQPVPMAQQPLQVEVPQQPVYQPMVFRVFNPQTGMYEEKSMDNMAAPVPMVQQPAQVQTYQQPVQMQQYQQIAPAAPAIEQKVSKAAKKTKEEKGFGEQLLESFARSATTSSGRTLGSQLTRSLLGTLGIGKRK